MIVVVGSVDKWIKRKCMLLSCCFSLCIPAREAVSAITDSFFQIKKGGGLTVDKSEGMWG